jgi:hypothetical protein
MANFSGMNWKLIPPQRVINAMLGLAQGKTTTENSQSSTNGANGHVSTVSKEYASNSDAATNDGTQASSKTKKKKKNKKKRQGNGGTTEDASPSTDGDDNQHDTDSDTPSPHDDSTEGEESNQKQAIESNGEYANSSIAPTDLEAERRERKREKNREKKRKNKMNKKNRISQSSEHSLPDSR